MASMIASTLALSRPSEKFGTHSTIVDITDEDNGRDGKPASFRTGKIVIGEAGNASPCCGSQLRIQKVAVVVSSPTPIEGAGAARTLRGASRASSVACYGRSAVGNAAP